MLSPLAFFVFACRRQPDLAPTSLGTTPSFIRNNASEPSPRPQSPEEALKAAEQATERQVLELEAEETGIVDALARMSSLHRPGRPLDAVSSPPAGALPSSRVRYDVPTSPTGASSGSSGAAAVPFSAPLREEDLRWLMRTVLLLLKIEIWRGFVSWPQSEWFLTLTPIRRRRAEEVTLRETQLRAQARLPTRTLTLTLILILTLTPCPGKTADPSRRNPSHGCPLHPHPL